MPPNSSIYPTITPKISELRKMEESVSASSGENEDKKRDDVLGKLND